VSVVVPFVDLRQDLAPSRAQLLSAFDRVLDSGRFVLGPEVEQFERAFAGYCGVAHGIGVGNGLDALFLALQAVGVGAGDEVIVPAHTFVATWLAVTRCGAIPVAAEPDPVSCLVTAETIERLLTDRTRAVIAVHLYGSLTGIDAIAAMCRDRGIALVEDAAQAHGARVNGVCAGAFGTAGCFSFYPTKNLGCLGDGGMVVTGDDAVADRVRVLRNYGGRSRYQHEVEGINSRLDELQAALLHVRLKSLDAGNARRREIAAAYLAHLSGIPGLQLPQPGADGSHVWHLFVVQAEERDRLQQHLAGLGIETLVHYPAPPYRLPPFANYAPPSASVSDAITRRALSLPCGTHLSDEQVQRVCEAVKGYFRHSGGRSLARE
jgi:dTDP-3-amino-3,4,6-trideoxy-alpha-D-glucose transaminase